MEQVTKTDQYRKILWQQLNVHRPYSSYHTIMSAPEELLPSEEKHKLLAQFAANANRQAPGIIILKGLNDIASFDDLFRAFCSYGNINWTWKPEHGMDARKLLDKVTAEGECGTFAEALFILATTPKPLGLGLPADEFEIVTYKGALNLGFILDESKLPILAKRCNSTDCGNVFKKNGTKTTLTLWGNHKVVRYKHQLWDPSYGAKYATVDECIKYEIIKNEGRLEVKKRGGHKCFFFDPQDVPLPNGRVKYLGPYEEATIASQKIRIFPDYF